MQLTSLTHERKMVYWNQIQFQKGISVQFYLFEQFLEVWQPFPGKMKNQFLVFRIFEGNYRGFKLFYFWGKLQPFDEREYFQYNIIIHYQSRKVLLCTLLALTIRFKNFSNAILKKLTYLCSISCQQHTTDKAIKSFVSIICIFLLFLRTFSIEYFILILACIQLFLGWQPQYLLSSIYEKKEA